MNPGDLKAITRARDALAQAEAYLARHSEGIAILHQAPEVIYSPLHEKTQEAREGLDEILRETARASHPGRPRLELVANLTKEK